MSRSLYGMFNSKNKVTHDKCFEFVILLWDKQKEKKKNNESLAGTTPVILFALLGTHL